MPSLYIAGLLNCIQLTQIVLSNGSFLFKSDQRILNVVTDLFCNKVNYVIILT